jgi:ureidoglycolate dehydrogenase (NAD+)
MSQQTVVLSADSMRETVAKIFEMRGMKSVDAARVAEVLVWADAGGHTSHGVSRVGRYLDFIKNGDLDPKGTPTIGFEFGAMTRLDGARCAGAVAVSEATNIARRSARANGVGLCLVRETTHVGAVGFYAQNLALSGHIGIIIAASGPMMAYHGAATPGLSTAPLAVGVPSGRFPPLILDMATSVAALGKIRQAAAKGSEIPLGWALDGEGRPTTNPNDAQIQLPLGGHKGSGLALMFECVASLLSDSPLISLALAPEARKRHSQNAAVIAIDISRALPIEKFRNEVDQLVEAIQSLRPSEGQQIVLPGERSQRLRRAAEETGIPLRREVWDYLQSLAAS